MYGIGWQDEREGRNDGVHMFVFPSKSRVDIRPPLKKMLFLVQRSGDFITAEWEFLFSFCHIFVFVKNVIMFLPPKKREKKKILRPPDGPQFRSLARQETNFFLRVALFWEWNKKGQHSNWIFHHKV